MTTRSDLVRAYNDTTRAELARGANPEDLADMGYDFFEATQKPITEGIPGYSGSVAAAQTVEITSEPVPPLESPARQAAFTQQAVDFWQHQRN